MRLNIESVLDVGSSIGLNLHFIDAIFEGRLKLYAVDPNRKAFDRLLSLRRIKITKAWNCDVFRLPLPDLSIDLVFTSGVLIHIAPEDLGRATDEIVRVARR
jgi:ubiquinone/menaquinone biosynthesis C-methylase UbiE